MRILKTETVVRHLCEYDEGETGVLKAVGQLPPWARSPAKLWLTEEEKVSTDNLIALYRRESM